jgi:hypothetical protein
MRQNRAGAQRPARRVGTLRRHDTARRNGSLRRHGSLQRHGSLRRRGTVLIMVVAVLGILFVAGAALLNVVTFSSRSLDAAKIDRENRDAVDALERLVTRVLAEAFIGPDGIPFAPESPLIMHKPGRPFEACDDADPNDGCVLALPAPAEIPGVHPWLDVTEPIENSATGHAEYRLVSNLRAALENTSPHTPFAVARDLARASVSDQLKNGLQLSNPGAKRKAPSLGDPEGEDYESGAVPLITGPRYEPEWLVYNDADGDGILAEVEVPLPANLLSPELRRALSNRLRDSRAAGDLETLTLTVRVVPHGAMADVNASHPYIQLNALGLYEESFQPISAQAQVMDTILANAPYLPESNEWMLRNRGMLLPLSAEPTRLIADMAIELFAPKSLDSELYDSGLNAAIMAEPTSRRWWRYDPILDTETSDGAWRRSMNPEKAIAKIPSSEPRPWYDVQHNLTTVSYDDLLMRNTTHPVWGVDLVTWLIEKEDSDPTEDNFGIDNYPPGLDGSDDPRRGRLKISLPNLDQMTDERVIRTLRDAFTLMLAARSDFDANNVYDHRQPWSEREPIEIRKAATASMLAANIVDFSDGGDAPTAVAIVDTNGVAVTNLQSGEPLTAFGFERQPFITEIYTKVVSSAVGATVSESDSVFAVELYNPYDTPLPLTGYKLVDLRAEDVAGDTNTALRDETAGLIKRFVSSDSAVELDGISIQGNSFYILCGYGDCPGVGSGQTQYGKKLGDFAIDPDSVIALMRTVQDLDDNPVDIIVDVMQVNDSATAVVRRGASAPPPGESAPNPDPDIGVNPGVSGSVYEVSLQRDTSSWHFVVPKATKLFAAEEMTLGAANHPNAVDSADPIYPVHYDVANNDNYTYAFPTTGALLLVGRMAHIYDPTPLNSTGGSQRSLISPFNRVHPALVGTFSHSSGVERERNITGQFDQIDNGRIPVFDVQPYRDSTPRESSGFANLRGQIESAEMLPWGQFVFDYFTAIPYEICPENTMGDPTCQSSYEQDRLSNLPPVDQEGMRVRGRININAAPWQVLAGLPMLRAEDFPDAFEDEISEGLRAVRGSQGALGENLAKAIVAYREGRDSWGGMSGGVDVGQYEQARNPYEDIPDPSTVEFRPRRGFGFLTVGELLNVRHTDRPEELRMDAGVVDPDVTANQSEALYERAVANVVALDDWVTTRSHVFTIYGVIRGAHAPLPASTDPDYDAKLRSFNEANQKAIRFQSTVDRLPMIFGSRQPVRIGSRITGGYADVRSE